jgi:phosphoglycerol transferase MdoB-like AlkP superfamily enzyme
MKDSSTQSGGVGFFGLLTITFIVLKLTGFIDWSWWWVLSPIWGITLLVVALVALIIFVD